MQKSKLRWLKILELLLLIIRMMILALIALAFARPALTGKRASSHAPASIVILLDNSPSVEMLSSGGTVFDDMKRGIDDILSMLNANDEATLITLSGQQSVIGPYSDIERIRSTLYSLQPQASPPSFSEGLSKAAQVLSESHNLNREIYIFSDFQSGEWWNLSFDMIDTDYRYFAVKYFYDGADNIGITKTEFPPQLLAPGEEFEIAVHLKNFSDKSVKSRLIELFIDNNKKAQTAIDIKPFGTESVKFAVMPESPGHHRGYFEIEDDDYSPDNKFYFNFEIPERISALGVGDSQKDVKILANCLNRSETGYIDFTGIEVNAFSRQNLSVYDVVILNNISALPQSYFNSLGDFTGAGGGLLIILGDKSNIESYKTFIEKETDINLTEKVKTSPRKMSESYFYLDDFDLTHPIFKIYSPENLQQSEIPQLKLTSFTPLSGGIPLARLEDNRSVLSFASNSKTMVMGFGLGRESSDISVHSFIVPFIIRTVEYLASRPGMAEEYYISGRSVTINLPGHLEASSVKLSKYDNSSIAMDGQIGETGELIEISRGAYGAFINIPSAGYPGFYTITAGRDTVSFFSVNHDSTESSNETLNLDELTEILRQDIVFIDGKSNIKTEIMQAKFGFELWKYCLLLALGLLIAESVLVKKAK